MSVTIIISKFIAHSAVWGHFPIQRQNTNSKTLTIEKLSRRGLRRYTKFGQAHLNEERKITLWLILHFIMGFMDLIWVTSSAENIYLAKKERRDLNKKSA